MHEADLVANTVKTWLDNPISRSLLRWVSKRTEKGISAYCRRGAITLSWNRAWSTAWQSRWNTQTLARLLIDYE